MKQRVKLDIHNLFRMIDEVISNTRAKKAIEYGIGISFGLELLQAYLKEIGELAIKQDNKELIEILMDLHVLKKEDE